MPLLDLLQSCCKPAPGAVLPVKRVTPSCVWVHLPRSLRLSQRFCPPSPFLFRVHATIDLSMKRPSCSSLLLLFLKSNYRMGSAFCILIGIAAIVGAIASILSCYASYAAKLNWWAFKSESLQEVSLCDKDRKLLREIAIAQVELKRQLRINQESAANM